MSAGHHRRGPQRAGGGGLSRARGPQAARAREARRSRRLRGHARDPSRLPRSRARARGRRPRRHRPRSRSRATGAARRAAADDDALRAVGGRPRADPLARSGEDVAGAGGLVAEGRRALAGVPGSDRRHRARARSADAPDAARRSTAVAGGAVGPVAAWAKDIRGLGRRAALSGCCAGGRWPSPISRRSGSRRRCCARWWRRAGSSAPTPARGRRGRRWRVAAAGGVRSAHPAGAPSFVVGGPGSLAARAGRAATSAGAEIRTNASVARIEVDDGRDRASSSRAASQIARDAVLSNADPKRTLLGLVDPMRLAPAFLQQDPATTASAGVTGEGQPRARRRCRRSRRCAKSNVAGRDCSRRPHPHRPGRRLPRARVRLARSTAAVGSAVARGGDPVARRSDAGAGRQARDVDLRAVGALSRCARATGTARARRSAISSIAHAGGVRAGSAEAGPRRARC